MHTVVHDKHNKLLHKHLHKSFDVEKARVKIPLFCYCMYNNFKSNEATQNLITVLESTRKNISVAKFWKP